VENTLRDILNSIAERDIYTGDGIEIVTCDAQGVRT
jgi:20S proteasome alpha/beta subunit